MERTFEKEIGQLRAGAGEPFRGEGILAITKGLLQSGVDGRPQLGQAPGEPLDPRELGRLVGQGRADEEGNEGEREPEACHRPGRVAASVPGSCYGIIGVVRGHPWQEQWPAPTAGTTGYWQSWGML